MLSLRRAVHPLYRAFETRVHPLRYLFLEITQRCNLACRHCGSDCSSDAHQDELSTHEWVTLIERLSTRFEPPKVALVMTGGEPLCHPELDILLETMNRYHFPFGLVTNAWALSARNVDRLHRAGIRSITVSLDGLKRQHDWLRGRSGSFERAVDGLRRLATLKLPMLDVVTCVHPGNLGELESLRQLIIRLQVPAWRLFSIFPTGRARRNPELLLEPAQFSSLLGFIRDARQRSEGMSISFSCEGYLGRVLDRHIRDEPYFCRAGISVGSVLCDGSISACPNITRSLVQGNVRWDDFAEVWNTRFAPFRKRDWMKTGPCSACRHWRRCQGNSLHLWDEQTGQTALCSLQHAGVLLPPGSY